MGTFLKLKHLAIGFFTLSILIMPLAYSQIIDTSNSSNDLAQPAVRYCNSLRVIIADCDKSEALAKKKGLKISGSAKDDFKEILKEFCPESELGSEEPYVTHLLNIGDYHASTAFISEIFKVRKKYDEKLLNSSAREKTRFLINDICEIADIALVDGVFKD